MLLKYFNIFVCYWLELENGMKFIKWINGVIEVFKILDKKILCEVLGIEICFSFLFYKENIIKNLNLFKLNDNIFFIYICC